jgi:ArsR family transcriptional regulator
MPAIDRKRLAARANIIKALAHPSRLMMVEELSARERCVCELAELVGADMSTVSKHLSILRNAGIVEDEKRGSMVFYRLRTRCVFRFFECVEAISKESAAAGGER